MKPHPFAPLAFLAVATGLLFSPAARAAEGSVLSLVPAPAQARAAAVQIRVAPDRADWTYTVGQPARFLISVTADRHPLTDAVVRYRVGPEMLTAEERSVPLPAGGLVIEAGTMSAPGFIRCVATVEVAGRMYRSVATAGFEPEKIQPTQVEPPDFDAFWTAGREELARVPMQPRQTLIPEASTGTVNVYHVSLRNVGGTGQNPARVYGILCVPKAPGRYPAVLSVPGAGIRPYAGLRELAARGVITLQIGIHGLPVNLAQEVYDQLASGGLTGYPTLNLDSRDTYYYRRVYLGCVRANDFLVSLPEFDGQNLLVTGGSQGGQLSLVTAALDPRVKSVAAYYPAYCDVTGYLHGRAGGWPHMMRTDPRTGAASPHATPAKIAVTAYYDVVNFARRIKVPVHLAWGYNDETCPPTSMYSAYNVITAPKQLLLALETGHNTVPEETDAINAWINGRLGVK
jgi:cephalosporin-C deacetylase-like acetyl esterase